MSSRRERFPKKKRPAVAQVGVLPEGGALESEGSQTAERDKSVFELPLTPKESSLNWNIKLFTEVRPPALLGFYDFLRCFS